MNRILTVLLLFLTPACVIHAGRAEERGGEAPAAEPVFEVEVVALQHAVAHQLASVMKDSLKHLPRLRVVPDSRTNSLVLTGTARELRAAHALIDELDQPAEGPGS
jgi:type II secretory pathway component GspD/PulD (secretin)